MTMVEIEFTCGCHLFFAIGFDDYTDCEYFILEEMPEQFSCPVCKTFDVEDISEYLFEVL